MHWLLSLCAEGDPLGQFAVVQLEDDQWGLISKEPLDREAMSGYSLTITATDGRFQSLATVELHVQDINDNSPHCQQVLTAVPKNEINFWITFVVYVWVRFLFSMLSLFILTLFFHCFFLRFYYLYVYFVNFGGNFFFSLTYTLFCLVLFIWTGTVLSLD